MNGICLNVEYVVVDNLSFPGDVAYTYMRRADGEPLGGWYVWNQREIYRGTERDCLEYLEKRRNEQ
jgi:hypothetical protein